MINLIILVVLIGFSVYLIDKGDIWELVGQPIGIVLSITLIIHLISWSCNHHDYKVFLTERESFTQTIKDVGVSATFSEVKLNEKIKFNKKLARKKLSNKTFLLGCYIDDRFEGLKPIE